MMEKCADESDHASALQAHADEVATAKVRAEAQKAMQPQTDPRFDGVHCVECDDDLPAPRLAAGRVRCTACESALERLRKLQGQRK
jgi:RNA polymerase-binding transcription factor DksA